MTGSPPVPAPPQGPGVRVPFASPPSERDRKRLWISLGIGGAALVLCCGGGVAALGGLVVATDRAVPAEAKGVVTDFLDGLSHRDYRRAYNQVCSARQSDQTLDEFTAVEKERPGIQSFQLGEPTIVGSQISVTAEVRTVNGSLGPERYTVISDRQAGALRVCGGPR